MKVIHTVELKPGSYEEMLPDFSPDFPYIASYVELEKHLGRQSPWHWHKEVELFYMKEGALEYNTPPGENCVSAGVSRFCQFERTSYVKGETGRENFGFHDSYFRSPAGERADGKPD